MRLGRPPQIHNEYFFHNEPQNDLLVFQCGSRLAPRRSATHCARIRRSRVYVRPKQITPASRLGGK